MEWLNYHHLLYFYVVAKEGGIARASEQLLLAQPTISAQIHALEESLGEKLFQRSGRSLILTDFGRVVFQYAEEIFGIGRELMDFVHGRPTGKPLRLNVGVSDSLPKTLVHRLLMPAFQIPEKVHLICQEDHPENLVVALSTHKLDVMLSDSTANPGGKIRTFHHLLGSSGFGIYAAAKVAKTYRDNLPQSLDGAPFLLPLDNSGLRRSLEQWFDAEGIRPRIVAEFKDTALAKAFGEAGLGVFAAPTVVDADVRKEYGVVLLHQVDAFPMRFYAISVERRFKHPGVLAILQAARDNIFADHRGADAKPEEKKRPPAEAAGGRN